MALVASHPGGHELAIQDARIVTIAPLERRFAKRIPARLKVWCEGDDFTLLTESINVSTRGIFVRVSSPPALGTRFKAMIDDLGLVAHVEVRWVRLNRDVGKTGMGLHVLKFERGATALSEHIQSARLSQSHWTPMLLGVEQS